MTLAKKRPKKKRIAKKKKPVELRICFENKKAALFFKEWLCGQGEHDYTSWLNHQICIGDIVVSEFNSQKPNSLIVQTKLGW